MKYLKTFNLLNEGKNIGLLYHFTTLSDAISIVNDDRLYSTQNVWSMSKKSTYGKNKKYSGQISFTRDKFLYQEKPKGVSFGVRFVFDGNKLSEDFKIKPVKFSSLWKESEEAIFTIGNWSDRPELKKHQIFNLKKYIVSIDLMPFDIYKDNIESYEMDNYDMIGISEDDISTSGKPKRTLVNKAKKWLEDSGYNTRIVGDKINVKSYIADRKLKTFEEVYYDSRKPVDGYIDANDLVGQRLWFHTNRTHRNNGWNGMIGIYDTTRSGRKVGLAGKYTNEVRLTSPIFFQTSETGAENIKAKGDRTLIAGVSGVVIPTNSNTSGMQKITYNPFDVGYFHLVDDKDKKEIVSADEVYFVASEEGNWEIWVINPKFKMLSENLSTDPSKSIPEADKDYINDILLELDLIDMRFDMIDCYYHRDESDRSPENLYKRSLGGLIKTYKALKIELWDKEKRFFTLEEIEPVLTSLRGYIRGKYEIDLSYPNEMVYLPVDEFIDEFDGEELYTLDIYIYEKN